MSWHVFVREQIAYRATCHECDWSGTPFSPQAIAEGEAQAHRHAHAAAYEAYSEGIERGEPVDRLPDPFTLERWPVVAS